MASTSTAFNKCVINEATLVVDDVNTSSDGSTPRTVMVSASNVATLYSNRGDIVTDTTTDDDDDVLVIGTTNIVDGSYNRVLLKFALPDYLYNNTSTTIVNCAEFRFVDLLDHDADEALIGVPVTLQMHQVRAEWNGSVRSSSSSTNSGVYEQQTRNATDGETTWTHSVYPTTLWSNPGGVETMSTEIATETITVNGDETYHWYGGNDKTKTMVQSWISEGVEKNTGIALVQKNEGFIDGYHVYDGIHEKEFSAAVGVSPRLIITYTQTDGPSSSSSSTSSYSSSSSSSDESSNASTSPEQTFSIIVICLSVLLMLVPVFVCCNKAKQRNRQEDTNAAVQNAEATAAAPTTGDETVKEDVKNNDKV